MEFTQIIMRFLLLPAVIVRNGMYPMEYIFYFDDLLKSTIERDKGKTLSWPIQTLTCNICLWNWTRLNLILHFMLRIERDVKSYNSKHSVYAIPWSSFLCPWTPNSQTRKTRKAWKRSSVIRGKCFILNKLLLLLASMYTWLWKYFQHPYKW